MRNAGKKDHIRKRSKAQYRWPNFQPLRPRQYVGQANSVTEPPWTALSSKSALAKHKNQRWQTEIRTLQKAGLRSRHLDPVSVRSGRSRSTPHRPDDGGRIGDGELRIGRPYPNFGPVLTGVCPRFHHQSQCRAGSADRLSPRLLQKHQPRLA